MRELRYVVFAGVLWIVFWLFCRPVVVLHYAANATEPLTYYFVDNHWTFKEQMNPGESVMYYTDMFPGPHTWLNLSLPLASHDEITLDPSFSRVDIYIDAQAKIERPLVRHGFFDRFSEPESDETNAHRAGNGRS